MFLDYHGYKLRVSGAGVASYVTPEITIYKELSTKEVNVYTRNWCARIYREDGELVEKIITGELYDRILENNPFVPRGPTSFVGNIGKWRFELPFRNECSLIFIVGKREKLLVSADIVGKKMYARGTVMKVDGDYRLFVEPWRQKTVKLPCLNGYVLAKERVYIEDAVDRFHEEIEVKAIMPFIGTKYIKEIQPDSVYVEFYPRKFVALRKENVTAVYYEYMRRKYAEVYHGNRVVSTLKGNKKDILHTLAVMMNLGDLVELV